jgi:hypothetical protein
MELIGEDIAVQVTFGGAVDGTPTWGTAASVKCIARRVMASKSVPDIDMSTLCGGRRERPGKATASVEIEGLVPAAGYTFNNTNANVGTYIKVETKPLSTLASYNEWVGYISEWTWDAAMDTPQAERVRINCNAVVDES